MIYKYRDCSGLTSVTIPSSVTSIGQNAFSGCSGLTSVHISNFAQWCQIDFSSPSANPLFNAHHLYINEEEIVDLVISEEISKIAPYAFYGCNNMNSVKVKWNRPLANGAQFDSDFKQSVPLYVPKGTAIMYMAAEGWSEFTNIVEFEDGDDAHYITIRMGDVGVLKQSVEVGQTYTYAVSADEGWEVNTLTFDGKDMTSLLLDGQFSTPVITGNSELNVVFLQKGNDVKERSAESNVKVYAHGKNVTVKGAKENAPVRVFTTGGVLVKSSVGNATIPLESGVYIIKVGNETFKVAL